MARLRWQDAVSTRGMLVQKCHVDRTTRATKRSTAPEGVFSNPKRCRNNLHLRKPTEINMLDHRAVVRLVLENLVLIKSLDQHEGGKGCKVSESLEGLLKKLQNVSGGRGCILGRLSIQFALNLKLLKTAVYYFLLNLY